MTTEILQRLYDSEINFSIEAPMWDIGITFRLMNPAGKYIEFHNIHLVKEGFEWLINNVLELYPDSDFAKWWNENYASSKTNIVGFGPITLSQIKEGKENV